MKQPNTILRKKEPKLLLIATSARALLESALRGAYSVAVIDGFCDSEVMHHASVAMRVGLSESGGLDDSELADAVKTMSRRYKDSLKVIVVGSGIEGCDATLEAIRQSNILWLGNRRAYYRFDKRNNLKVQFDRVIPMPDCLPPYLYKSVIGSGGVHIYRDDRLSSLKTGYYRQSYLPLTSISHLFLADGNRIETVGFSTQWHSKHDPTRPFCYGGAINAHALDACCVAQAEAVARTFDLSGLNNIDYLYDGTRLYFLELNPRPSATMALYDEDYAEGLLHAHIKACRAEGLERCAKKSLPCRAFAIFYAEDAIRLPGDFEWPDGTKDVAVENPSGYRYSKNAPICTVHARANSVATVLLELQSRIRDLQKRIEQRLQTTQPAINTEQHHETLEHSYQ